jgi:hypothetical protein
MHSEYRSRLIDSLLAMKGNSDDAFINQVRTIGVTATRGLLSSEATRLHHADQQTAMDCAALVDRIDALIRTA